MFFVLIIESEITERISKFSERNEREKEREREREREKREREKTQKQERRKREREGEGERDCANGIYADLIRYTCT